MTQKLLTLPFRLSFGAARTAIDISVKTLDVSAKLAQYALGTVLPTDQETQPESPETPATPPSSSRPKPEREPRESRVNGHSAAPPAPPAPPAPIAPPAPVTPPSEQPPTPLTHEQEVVKTLQDEEEVVAEFAEPGAEDGAGAQLDVEEPWKGYAQMNANTVIDRIEQADQAQLALLELYEQTHRKRQTVLSAAGKRLRALSSPEPRDEGG